MSNTIKVLFVCVHNAGRSQMAEALLRKLGGSSFEVASAGFEPRPVNPLVVEAMKLIGIDIKDAKSKSVFDLFRAGRYFDYVVTVCDESSAERCRRSDASVCNHIHALTSPFTSASGQS